MRIAALILGILGGVFGLFSGLFATAIGGAAAALEVDGGSTVAGLGFLSILVSIFGIVAGALAIKYPKFSGWSQIACVVVGFIAVSGAWILAGLLFLVGGILALVSARQQTAA